MTALSRIFIKGDMFPLTQHTFATFIIIYARRREKQHLSLFNQLSDGIIIQTRQVVDKYRCYLGETTLVT